MSRIRQIIYVSQAKQAFSPTALLELLSFCRKANPKAGLSGLLSHRDDVFIQLLEGPSEQVAGAYARITKDPRHYNLRILADREVPERYFPDWSMGFEEVNEVALMAWPGLNHVLQPPRTVDEWVNQPDYALAFFDACRVDSKLSRSAGPTPGATRPG